MPRAAEADPGLLSIRLENVALVLVSRAGHPVLIQSITPGTSRFLCSRTAHTVLGLVQKPLCGSGPHPNTPAESSKMRACWSSGYSGVDGLLGCTAGRQLPHGAGLASWGQVAVLAGLTGRQTPTNPLECMQGGPREGGREACFPNKRRRGPPFCWGRSSKAPSWREKGCFLCSEGEEKNQGTVQK